MKSLKITVPLLIIVLLTACVNQKQLNIDEFLKKYNEISESELRSSMFDISADNEQFIYSRIENGVLLCLYSEKDGEIIQCTVTAKRGSEKSFNSLCLSITEAFTGLSAEESEKLFKSPGISGRYKLTINDYGIGKTMILNRADNELNTNDLPTLKRKVKEEDIARPTLSDTDNSTKDIRQ